jgi:glycine cleavage system protein P-like pyridoxal-binding family
MLNDIEQIEDAAEQFSGTQDMIDTLDAWINRIQESIVTGVDRVTVMPTTVSNGVYSISGKLVKTQSDNLNDLPKGVYIVNGKKVVK